MLENTPRSYAPTMTRDDGKTASLAGLQKDRGNEYQRVENQEYEQERVHGTKSETPPARRKRFSAQQ